MALTQSREYGTPCPSNSSLLMKKQARLTAIRSQPGKNPGISQP
jgi:hypothetical protein